jgi:hypothetical protein
VPALVHPIGVVHRPRAVQGEPDQEAAVRVQLLLGEEEAILAVEVPATSFAASSSTGNMVNRIGRTGRTTAATSCPRRRC